MTESLTKKWIFQHVWNLVYHSDADPDPDLDRQQHWNSDPGRHQNDADTQRANTDRLKHCPTNVPCYENVKFFYRLCPQTPPSPHCPKPKTSKSARLACLSYRSFVQHLVDSLVKTFVESAVSYFVLIRWAVWPGLKTFTLARLILKEDIHRGQCSGSVTFWDGPDHWRHTPGLGIWILLFSSTKNKFVY